MSTPPLDARSPAVRAYMDARFRDESPEDKRATCDLCGTYYNGMLRNAAYADGCLCHACAEDEARAELYDKTEADLASARERIEDLEADQKIDTQQIIELTRRLHAARLALGEDPEGL